MNLINSVTSGMNFNFNNGFFNGGMNNLNNINIEDDNDDDYTIPDIDTTPSTDGTTSNQTDGQTKEEEEDEEESLAKKLKTYQAKILFYAFFLLSI